MTPTESNMNTNKQTPSDSILMAHEQLDQKFLADDNGQQFHPININSQVVSRNLPGQGNPDRKISAQQGSLDHYTNALSID